MRTIRPVTYEDAPAVYRTAHTASDMAEALMAHCEEDDPARRAAAMACFELEEGQVDPEAVRALFIEALEAADVFVRS